MTIFASLPLSPHVEAVCFDFPSRCNLSSPWCVPPSHFLSSIVPLLLCPHSLQTTDSFLAIFLFLSTFSFLQLYEMSVCWMKFGFQLSGTHRPVSHTHTALGLISFANIASPNTTSETHSLALLPWEKGDPQFFLPVKVISHCNVVHVYDWFKSLILEWLWSNIQQECIWGTVSHYDFL